MPIKRLNLNPYIENPDLYITRNLLNSLDEELKAYKDIAEVRPDFQPFVYEIVRDIEQVRKELDAKECFVEKNR